MDIVKSIDPGRVAIYIRWSTEDQREGTTLEVQREACRAFVASQGWTVLGWLEYVDDGVSGGSLERPGLTRLRAAVAAGLVDCVVVYKLDRLSRSVVDMVRLVLDEWDGRCHVKSAREPIDTVSQAGRLFFYQLMSFAEWERSVIRERTFAGKLRRAQEGRNPGISAAYGYRLGPDGRPVVEPGEAQVVQLIFRLYLSGLGCTQIGRRLAELGHPSPARRRWGSGQVSRLLSNPVYMGTLVYGKQVSSRGRRVKSERPHVVREGAVPALVTPAEFAAVQALKAGRPGVGRGQGSGRSLSSRSLLTGVLRCECGRAFCGNGGSGARFRYRYYYCGCAGDGGTGRIRQAALDALVAEALLSRLTGLAADRPDEVRGLRERVGAEFERAAALAGAAAVAAERDLARAREKEARLRSLFLDGRVEAEEYRELLGEVRRQREEAAARVRGARERAALAGAQAALVGGTPGGGGVAPLAPGAADGALQAPGAADGALQAPGAVGRVPQAPGAQGGDAPLAPPDLAAHWQTLTVPDQKRLLRHFVRQVTAHLDRETGILDVTITWHATGGEG